MLGLMGDNKPCIPFHHLFLQQLPTYVRSQLAHRDFTDLRELSLEADNIYLAGKATGQHVQEVNAASSATRQRPNRSSSTSSAESLCYYHRIYGTRARKCCEPCKHHATFQQKNRKTRHRSTANVSNIGPHQQQLLVAVSIFGRCFLVDTGAQVSVVPATLRDTHFGASDERLQAANGTSISTYGAQHVSLRLGTATYNVRLVKADVKRPLLGADFLRQYNLLVDIRGKRLIEADTYTSLPCSSIYINPCHLATIYPSANQYHKVLQDYPEILQPHFSSDTVRQYCATSHHDSNSSCARQSP